MTLATEQNFGGIEKSGYGISTGGRVGGWKIGFFRPVLTLPAKIRATKWPRYFFYKKKNIDFLKIDFFSKKIKKIDFFGGVKKSIFWVKKIAFFIDKINQKIDFLAGGQKIDFLVKKIDFWRGVRKSIYGPKNPVSYTHLTLPTKA